MDKFDVAYMKTAKTFAELSSAVRLKVGAIIVKDKRIISIGYNGTPSGWDNDCEHVVDVNVNDARYSYDNFSKELKTKPEVLHAEENAICKLARSHESGEGADLYITHAPCMQCAKLIYASGIKRVYYLNTYKSLDGLTFLDKCDIMNHKIELDE